MDFNFDQESYNLASKYGINLLKEENTTKDFSGYASNEHDTIGSSHAVLEIKAKHKERKNGLDTDIENGYNLSIKEEPELENYKIEMSFLETFKNEPKDPYINECIKQEHELIEPVQVAQQNENLQIDNLHQFLYSALTKDKECPLNKAYCKVESNEATTDFKERHEIVSKDWNIKNEELDIKEDWAESDESHLLDCVSQDNLEQYEMKTSDEQNDPCGVKNVQKTSFERPHQLHNSEDVDMLNEDDFQTIHNTSNGIVTFKCIKCDFQTIYKRSLKRHRLMHNSSENVKIYKCNKCNFKTMHQRNLAPHLLRHKNSEMNILKCNKCVFQTLHRYNFRMHLLQHNNPLEKVQMFKCDHCSYQTIFKSYLNRHLPSHRNLEVEIFKCDKCDFQTIYKNYLNTHVLRHYDPDEVETFKCNKCHYQTIFKQSIQRHLLRHKKSEEGKVFKCNNCDFQTIFKQSLQRHLLRHSNPEEVKNFKCDQCSYKTMRKECLKQHILQHSKGSKEVEMFKCNECDFQTIRKTNLKAHVRRHESQENIDG